MMYLVVLILAVQGLFWGICLSIDVHPNNTESLVKAVQGEPAIVPCHTDLGTPVVWMFQSHPTAPVIELSKSGQIINGYSKYFLLDTIAKGDYNLVIKSANFSNAGLYTCDEEDGIGKRHTIIVSVSEPYTITTQIGGEVTLPCHLTSLSSTAGWQFRPSLTDTAVFVRVDGFKYSIGSPFKGQHNLLIHDAEPSDSGVYTCLENDGLLTPERANRTLKLLEPTTPFGRDVAISSIDPGVAICHGPNSNIGLIVVTVLLVCLIPGNVFCLVQLCRKPSPYCKAVRCFKKRPNRDDEVGLPMLSGSDGSDDLKNAVRKILTRTQQLKRDKYIFELTTRPQVFAACAQRMAEHIRESVKNVNVILGLNGPDTRGELLASRIAEELGLPFAEITESEVSTNGNPATAYETVITKKMCTVEMPYDVSAVGTNVVIVDNTIVNGVTMNAASNLAKDKGLEVVHRIGLMQVPVQRDADDNNTPYQATGKVVDWTLFDFQDLPEFHTSEE